jgi:membrane protease YdiL (CAAX protease family)
MSFFVAAMWSLLATLGFGFMLSVITAASGGTPPQVVSGILCQAVAYLATLLFFTLVHEKDRSLSEVFGLRRTSATLCLVAAALGVALAGPLNLLQDAIFQRYPLPEKEAQEWADALRAPLLHQKIAILVAVGVLAPFIEELFFRGALLRALRRRHPPGLTVIGVALLFAGAHVESRVYIPVFLAGLATGYVRILGGSLWPAIFLHGSFNTVDVIYDLVARPEVNPLSRAQNIAAAVASIALFVVYRALALRSDTCAQARAEDMA